MVFGKKFDGPKTHQIDLDDPKTPPSERFRRSTKTTPFSHPQSWRWKKNRWSKNLMNWLRMIPNSHLDKITQWWGQRKRKEKNVETWRVRLPSEQRIFNVRRFSQAMVGTNSCQDIARFSFYSFFTSSYLPSCLEVERTSIALNAYNVR